MGGLDGSRCVVEVQVALTATDLVDYLDADEVVPTPGDDDGFIDLVGGTGPNTASVLRRPVTSTVTGTIVVLGAAAQAFLKMSCDVVVAVSADLNAVSEISLWQECHAPVKRGRIGYMMR